MSILDIEDLIIGTEDREIVKGVSLSIGENEWFSLIGESGSGKSITAFSISRLLPEKLSIESGSIHIRGEDILSMDKNKIRRLRGKVISYIFQDYQNSFTPFIKIGKQLDEFISCHEELSRYERKRKILDMLNEVNLDGERIYSSYPFQLSGGQLQRVAIAQSIILNPELIIADEPTTALDAITGQSILKLLLRVKERFKCSILFITHDLRLVKNYSDSIAIMKDGEIIESGKKEEILNNPKEEYTKNLFASIPPLRNVPDRLPIYSCEEEKGMIS